MRIALDTNILAYAEGLNGLPMKRATLDLLDKLPQSSIVLPVQSMGELFQVLVRKARRTPMEAREAVLGWRNTFALVETSPAVLLAAVDLTIQQFSIWDGVILCAAAEADCRLLLSEDMQDGFVWKGVTVANPYAKSKHPLLAEMLKQ